MSKLVWQIRYVDNGFNKQVEPVDIKWFEYEDVEKAIDLLNILTETNVKINGYETWFNLELVKVDEFDSIVLLRYRGEE